MMKVLLVAAGVLVDGEGRMLLAQRPAGKIYAGYWEFPGGKLEEGETPEAALCRELAEELAVAIDPADLVPLTFVSHTYPEFHVLLPVYAAHRWQGDVRALEDQGFAWVTIDQLHDYQLLPTAFAILPHLEKYLSGL